MSKNVKRSRPDLASALLGKITQGTVFSCARAERYHNCEVYGIIITARCDIAQKKYPVLNFLPVVRLKDWLCRDGLYILRENKLSEYMGAIKNMLKEKDLSTNLLPYTSFEKIKNEYFSSSKSTSKKEKKTNERFCELTTKHKYLDEGDIEKDSKSIYQWFVKENPRKIDEIIKRLSRHDVLGYYFFETLSEGRGEDQGYVCLLREVGTLPKKVAEKLGSGLTYEEYRNISGDMYSGLGLTFKVDNFAMPIVQVNSPTLEHLLQSFGNLFGRIGVEDPEEDVIDIIIRHSKEN